MCGVMIVSRGPYAAFHVRIYVVYECILVYNMNLMSNTAASYIFKWVQDISSFVNCYRVTCLDRIAFYLSQNVKR